MSSNSHFQLDDTYSYNQSYCEAAFQENRTQSLPAPTLQSTLLATDGRSPPLRACVRCKNLRVKCESAEGSTACKRCLRGGHECLVPGRMKRKTTPKLHLLNYLLDQAEEICKLKAVLKARKPPEDGGQQQGSPSINDPSGSQTAKKHALHHPFYSPQSFAEPEGSGHELDAILNMRCSEDMDVDNDGSLTVFAILDNRDHVQDKDDRVGACARCKGLKVRCERRSNVEPCMRCLNGKHDCFFPGKNRRRRPPQRDQMLNRIREQAKELDELRDQLATIMRSQYSRPRGLSLAYICSEDEIVEGPTSVPFDKATTYYSAVSTVEDWDQPGSDTTYLIYEQTVKLLLIVFKQARTTEVAEELEACVRMASQSNPISAVLNGPDLFFKINQIAAKVQVDPETMRITLHNDGAHIVNILQDLLKDDDLYDKVLQLPENSAQKFLDSVQNILDQMPLVGLEDGVSFDIKARKLITRLSKEWKILPSSLFIQGVECVQSDTIFGGSFGDVYRGMYHGKDVALKRIRVFQRDTERSEIHGKLCREAIVWRKLDHPNVLPFLGIDSETFPTFLCLISPWMTHGTINRYLRDFGQSRLIVQLSEIAKGLEYLHSQGIAHGDLRGANILVDSEHHALLADFGLTVFSDATVATCSVTQGGTVRWMAPELLFPEEFGLHTFRRTPASDTYSYACVIYELYTGSAPWSSVSSDAAVSIKVVRGSRPERPLGSVVIPDALWDVVERCWKQDASERWTVMDALGSIELYIELQIH